MCKAIINISYRLVIDSQSTNAFEKNVFNFSYPEFWLKSQAYDADNRFNTFTQLKQHDGRANSLHYKTGFAVAGFIEALQRKIPGLKDNAGAALSFDTHRFEVIESDKEDASKHVVAIHFITGNLTLINQFGDYLLLAKGNEKFNLTNGISTDTFMLKMSDDISIIQYQPVLPSSEVTNPALAAAAL